jgi:hypothetical protein
LIFGRWLGVFPSLQKATPALLAWLLFLSLRTMRRTSINAFFLLRSVMLRRWIALAFLLGVAAAYASPVIQPRSLELLCSTNGAMKLISQTAQGDEASGDVMHCGLCAPLAVPHPVTETPLFSSALTYAVQRTAASALAALTRPPLPARGPPALS